MLKILSPGAPIRFTRNFDKRYVRLSPKIKNQFQQRLILFQQDHFHPILRNHQLTGRYQRCRSINVTGDYRAIYSVNIVDSRKIIVFEEIGTHSRLYQ
jgi:addiction module RelE/StbE family toxin